MNSKILLNYKIYKIKGKSCDEDACAKSFSGYFYVTLSVKQGEPLSPHLFILFIN